MHNFIYSSTQHDVTSCLHRHQLQSTCRQHQQVIAQRLDCLGFAEAHTAAMVITSIHAAVLQQPRRLLLMLG